MEPCVKISLSVSVKGEARLEQMLCFFFLFLVGRDLFLVLDEREMSISHMSFQLIVSEKKRVNAFIRGFFFVLT